MEAKNERCAKCWFNALQQRQDLNNNVKLVELPALVYNSLRRRRSRSRSLSVSFVNAYET